MIHKFFLNMKFLKTLKALNYYLLKNKLKRIQLKISYLELVTFF